ncbi:MAG TPA: Gfo/Idh/MocA family oxidoreductase [Candidatus Omnitrophota bacterium]|mgnify:CR=1 FL=1|nr:Gfo/Idh/MocA family oxidoreductase [Candidatus Omnitrophota bacterium]
MPKIKVFLIGTGHLGSKHLKTYLELSDKVEILGLTDINEQKGVEISRKYRVPYFKNYRQFPKETNAVNICTPTISHYEIAKFFLKKNIHTFIEKPITTTVKQANELIKIAQKNNLKLQIGHIERFNSAFQATKRFMRNPLFIECHRLNHFPNRSLDIGVILDLMIHDIDIILGLVPSKIKNIEATGINVLTNLEDIASVRITFHNGCVCNLTASRISEDIVRKIRIFQKNTYISLDYVQQEAFIYKKESNRILKHSLPIEKEQPLKQELAHFIDCIENNKNPLVSGIEGREALKVALTITKKIWDNNTNIL